VDLLGPGGEVGQELVADAAQLEGRVAAWAAVPHGPLDGQAARELVGQERVVELGDGDDGGVDGPAVDAAPGAVGPLDLVGDDDVGV